MTRTDEFEGMLAETVTVRGHVGDVIHAYLARPMGPGPFPGVVLLHHMPGWDDWYKEATRTFAYRGYAAIAPDLYCRAGHGTADEIGAIVRADGGVPDDQVVGDAAGAAEVLRASPISNGRIGVFGSCSGGRHAYLAACRSDAFDAVVDLWGGGVVMAEKDLTEKKPVAPVAYTADLMCPLLGLFGENDQSPPVEQVAIHEAELQRLGKQYEFHIYPDAGHGFFYHHRPAMYRAEQAVDGWAKVFAFFAEHLGTGA
jgi:carboxymethylenebutenolidase